MPDYNDPNNMDKRLKQDKVEREKKATSKGLWAAIILILIVIIVGFYLYTPRSVETITVYEEGTPASSVPANTTDQNAMPAAPPSTDTTTPTATPEAPNSAPADTNAVPPDVVAPSNNSAQ